jgi:hypothetical protein
MSNIFKSISPITKIFFAFSLLVLFLWVIPTTISYYKNQKIYNQKVIELNQLDSRKTQIDAKLFHVDNFKIDAKKYFDNVDVISAPNDKYKVTISFHIDALPKFYNFFKNISLNYRVLVEDNIIYKEKNKSIKVNFIVKPY